VPIYKASMPRRPRAPARPAPTTCVGTAAPDEEEALEVELRVPPAEPARVVEERVAGLIRVVVLLARVEVMVLLPEVMTMVEFEVLVVLGTAAPSAVRK